MVGILNVTHHQTHPYPLRVRRRRSAKTCERIRTRSPYRSSLISPHKDAMMLSLVTTSWCNTWVMVLFVAPSISAHRPRTALVHVSLPLYRTRFAVSFHLSVRQSPKPILQLQSHRWIPVLHLLTAWAPESTHPSMTHTAAWSHPHHPRSRPKQARPDPYQVIKAPSF